VCTLACDIEAKSLMTRRVIQYFDPLLYDPIQIIPFAAIFVSSQSLHTEFHNVRVYYSQCCKCSALLSVLTACLPCQTPKQLFHLPLRIVSSV